ncbi:MAG: excinuclease ABC subunit UvrA [Planctomycetaceae bacterium]|nr:excinuclease ABC subunit UvrA [Planctomycetaceae bacterium]
MKDNPFRRLKRNFPKGRFPYQPQQFIMIALLYPKKPVNHDINFLTNLLTDMIKLRRVSVHNLKGIDLDLPYRKLIVLCGRSGSGKSSLALDTLYAEGQRRYIETFSASVRQFLERLEKPDAERIDGIPPAVAVTAGSFRNAQRSTVGTVTEINAYLGLLFAKIGHIFCPQCSREVRIDTPQSILEFLRSAFSDGNQQIRIAFAPPLDSDREIFEMTWKERGFVRGSVYGSIDRSIDGSVSETSFRLDEGGIPPKLYQQGQKKEQELLLLVDRLMLNAEEERITDSLETALEHGEGVCVVLIQRNKNDRESFERLVFSRHFSCAACNIDFPVLEPKLFSFNNPQGACPVCEGLGFVKGVPCSDCGGTRLRPETLAVKILGNTFLNTAVNIATLSDMKITDLIRFFETLDLPEQERRLGKTPLEQIRLRLRFLQQVGLDYLSLSRPVPTLSGGEQRRTALTAALGSSLVDMLYVLDEPSIGLHPADTDKLLQSIRQLRDQGNTIILVEHEEAFLWAADHLVEIGPGAGESGGHIVFQGTVRQMLHDPNSLTGNYLAKMRNNNIPLTRRIPEYGVIEITGCRGHNLKNLTAVFPLGMLCVVSGVSGAGKSSLVQKTLYPALCRHFGNKNIPDGLPFDRLIMNDWIGDIVLADQNPIGHSPRSNPVTYLKIFDDIRNIFAATADARIKNLTASQFSFNIEGGRCEHCKGDGSIVIDMQFLPDMLVRCPQCRGRRYRSEILEILYRGKNIAEVLNMTAREAFTFFRGQSKTQHKLKRLLDVGLDYIRLGQPINTLSGGESQRLKLAAYLLQTGKGHSLILMDEPTTGLHFADIVQLLDCFNALIETGHSLIVVEHNLQVIRAADYVIDLGLGAADSGGEIVAQGTPEEIAISERSLTGKFLRNPVQHIDTL